MIIYNVTVKIETDIHEEWVRWMKDVHIPDVLKTDCFLEHKFCRIIGRDDDGPTYCVQYFVSDMKTLHQYQVKFAPALQKEHTAKFKDKALAFRTLLEVID